MTRHFHLLLATLLAWSLVLAACGNSGDDTAEEGDDTTTTAAADDDPGEDDPESDDATPDEPADEDDPADEVPEDTFVPLEGVPGVSDDEIAVGVIGTKSNNILGTCILDCYVTGIQAYFDMVNADGGLHGRQLVIDETLDDELFNNQARSLELIANEDSFAAFVATLQATGFGDLDDAGVPTFVWGIHATESNGRFANYGHFPVTCADCTGRSLPYMIQLAGGTKVASLGYGISENSKVCANTSAASVERYGADIGAEVVYVNDELEFGVPNGVGPQVTEMIDAGVDFVMSCLDLNAMKTIAQELERQGVRDQITLHHPNSYNQDFVAEAGALFDGDFVVPQFAPFESTVPAVDVFQEWVDANGGPVAEQTMVGWINADLFVQGLRATGGEFSREALVDTLNTEFTAYTADGLINEIDWSRQHVAPTPDDRTTNGGVYECSAIVTMQGGEFEVVGPPDAPFQCWDNSTTEWSEPEAMSFE